jgi:uncharacterized caspase-like protein
LLGNLQPDIRTARGVLCLLLFVLDVSAQFDPKAKNRDLTPTEPEKTATVTVPRGYALVIGIARYQSLSEQQQLKFPEADAAYMYTTLISPEGGQFPAENVHRLLGREATLANIQRELESWLPSVSKPEDRVLIYFVGHGFVWKDGIAYLAPYDLNPNDISGTSYSMDRLGEVLAQRSRRNGGFC